MTWLTEVCALARIEAAHPGRCQWVDFEAFLQAPAYGLSQIATDFCLSASDEEVAAAIAGPTMTRYSKDPSYAYGPADRRVLAVQAEVDHRSDIAQALNWLNGTGAVCPAAREAMTAMAKGVRS